MHNPALAVSAPPEARHSREAIAKRAISVIVVTILAAQFLIGFSYRGGQTFPIVAYPMYKQVHYEGERLNDYVVEVSTDGGAGRVLGPESMEISPWLYQKSLTAPIISGSPSPLGASVARAACATGATSVAISVYDSGYTLLRSGPVSDGRRLMGTATFDCSAL